MKYNIKNMNTYSRRIKTSFSLREQSLPEEYENSCRLCLTKDSLMTDIYNDDDIVPIPLKLRYCIALEVAKDDGLPSAVCTECMAQLNQSYAFKKRCLATDVKLRQFIRVPSFSKSLMLDVDSSSQEATLLETSEVNKNSKDACTIKIEESGLMYLHDFYSNSSCSSNGSSANNNDDDDNTDKDDEEEECDNGILDINDAVNIKPEYLGEITSEICDEKNKNTVSEENRRSTRIMLKRKRRLSPINSTSGNEESVSANKGEISIEKKPQTSCKTGYRCSSCNSRFLSYKELQGHIRTNHVETLKMCTICVKSFISNSTLERHMRIHTGEKPFVCQKCGKKFSQKEILNRHYFTHIKPFKCQYCSFTCALSDSLSNHVRSCHTNKESRNYPRYQCLRCDKAFCHSSGLSRHQAQHSGVTFRCILCNKIFSDRSSLKRHSVKVHPDAINSTVGS